MEVSCKTCSHAGLCVIRQKIIEETIMTFPDGKAVILDLENAMVSCDHYELAQGLYVPPLEDEPDYAPVPSDHVMGEEEVELPDIYKEAVPGTQMSAQEILDGPQPMHTGPQPMREANHGVEVRSGSRLGERKIKLNLANLGR